VRINQAARDQVNARRELHTSARIVIQHASAGDWYPQPWVLVCILERARDFRELGYVPPLSGILHYIAGNRAARN
jgi:hypothetical protein